MGGEREKKWPWCFLPGPPKWGENWWRKAQFELTKMLMCIVHMDVVLAGCFFFWWAFLPFFFFFFWASFLLFAFFSFFLLHFFFWLFLYFSVVFFFFFHLPLACAILKKKLKCPTSFSILWFFFSTKQIKFSFLHFSILPIKYIWKKTKFLLSSHFLFSTHFLSFHFSTPPIKWTLNL